MKQVSQGVLIYLTVCLLVSYSIASARLLPTHQGEELLKANEITHAAGSILNLQEDDLFNQQLGLEKCEDKDEDCIKRRMVAEAHLDYIYSQHQKPRGSP